MLAEGSGEFRSPETARECSKADELKMQPYAAQAISTPLIGPTRALQQLIGKWPKLLNRTATSPYPPLRTPTTLAFEDREKLSVSPTALKDNAHTSPHDPYTSRIEEEVRQKVSLDPKDDLDPVTLDEVKGLVKNLKTRKAPGLDGISNKAIKCFSSPLLALLVAIFNACLKNCYFPEVWKDAVIIGIPKPGKPRDLPASYRPISLLSSLGKLYEKILKSRLSDHLFKKGLIIDEQFGFRPQHSCPQQALRLVEYISEGFKRKHKTVAVFFDVAKAFDRVWHAGLIHKLYTLEVPDRLVLIIHKYISNRHFAFRHEHTISSKKILRAGVPQGSTLSPLLYSAYTNDIPRPKTGVQLALFADDTTLFLRSDSLNHIIPRLQRAINELTQWFQLWRIEVNSEKSAAIYFDFSNIKRTLAVPYNAPTLRISNAPIPWQHNYKYLGITLDKHLHFRDHIQRVRKLAIFYMSRLSGMIGRKSKMSLLNKRTLYTMCIRPVMTYACPVFAHAAPTALQDLQVIQNKFCRRATGAQWYVKNSVLHRDLELPTLSKFMKDASERFFSIAINHTNPLISAAASYEAPPENHFLRRPRNALSDPPDDLTARPTRALATSSVQYSNARGREKEIYTKVESRREKERILLNKEVAIGAEIHGRSKANVDQLLHLSASARWRSGRTPTGASP
ncbi:RNA-directed DNA polymerase from mobile element jockey [Eumeta japonica]|uniref:RNA-directed DNA polymerase from mobile element jockey n=1 Tax=Eumeta variegata TaxID=151549 RepID=A0A4C1X9X3_EUMVA|nr:RNA-directed DNA polymerase from mobile element jockey [Eumeta japonica]